MKRNLRVAFTLIELLIVIVILGIIAAIVIPTFTGASDSAKENALKTNLSSIRAQLEFCKFQHNGNYPVDNTSVATSLTTETELDYAAGDGTDDYGPYLMRIPNNSFTDSNDISDTEVSDSTDDTGWYYNSTDAGNLVWRANDFHNGTTAHFSY